MQSSSITIPGLDFRLSFKENETIQMAVEK